MWVVVWDSGCASTSKLSGIISVKNRRVTWFTCSAWELQGLLQLSVPAGISLIRSLCPSVCTGCISGWVRPGQAGTGVLNYTFAGDREQHLCVCMLRSLGFLRSYNHCETLLYPVGPLNPISSQPQRKTSNKFHYFLTESWIDLVLIATVLQIFH